MKLYSNNKLAISIAHNPVQYDQTQHVEIDRHFIKEKHDNELVTTPYISSDKTIDQYTDDQGNYSLTIAFNQQLEGEFGAMIFFFFYLYS